MTQIVSLSKAKEHLRIGESSVYDIDIAQKLAQASDIIVDYLKLGSVPSGWDVEEGDSPPDEGAAPDVVKAAVLLVLGELFKNREAGDVDLISLGVERLLMRQRDPTLA